MKRYIYITICLLVTACASPKLEKPLLIDGNIPEYIKNLV